MPPYAAMVQQGTAHGAWVGDKGPGTKATLTLSPFDSLFVPFTIPLGAFV